MRQVDSLGIEVGYRLIPMVDQNQGGELMPRIKGLRRKLTQELGFLVPAVHIRDNLELAPNAYRIVLQGVPAAKGEIHPERFLALDPGQAAGPIDGIKTRDPAFGLDATWIDAGGRDHAQAQGYTVVDPATVMATHLSQLIKDNADELLGHEEVQQLMDSLERQAPKLVEELTPKLLPLSVVVRVMQNLLAEKVPLRNLRAIAESLVEHAVHSKDPEPLTAAVRSTLGRLIVQEITGLSDDLPVITLDADLERMLQETTRNGSQVLEPNLTERLHQSIAEKVHAQQVGGEPSVLLVSGEVRGLLSRLTRRTITGLHVLAFHEVPDNKQIRLVATVGA